MRDLLAVSTIGAWIATVISAALGIAPVVTVAGGTISALLWAGYEMGRRETKR